jgi:predicted site-specific integrase-resolvase
VTRNWDSTGSATKHLSVCSRTLYIWEKAGKIEGFMTPGGKWRWNVEGFLANRKKLVGEKNAA